MNPNIENESLLLVSQKDAPTSTAEFSVGLWLIFPLVTSILASSMNARSLLPKIINGGIAGIIGVTAVFPIDLVKTRLQSQTIGPNGERMYNSIWDCFKKTYKTEGYYGMYRGSAVNIILITPEKAIKLTANDYFRYHLRTNDPVLPLPRQMLAGGLAGLFQIIVTTPMELLKIQMQDAGRKEAEAKAIGKKFKRPTALGTTIKLLKTKGIIGLYKGTFATGLRDITFSVFYFPLFATLNDLGPRKADGSGEAVFWCSLLAGLVAGASAAAGVTPFDVVKTRLQTDTATGTPKYKSIVDCFIKTVKSEGLRAFFKGGFCRMLVIAPLFGIAQMVYYLGLGEALLGVKRDKINKVENAIIGY